MRLRSSDTPVLVLRLDHYGALGVMRSLGRLGVPVYGVHKSAEAPALASRYARGGFVWDLDAAPAEASVARLCEIGAELGGRPILIPSNDETALLVAAHAGALRPRFRFQENSSELVRALYHKRAMQELAQRHGLPTARTWFPQTRDEVRALAARATFPILLKASDGIRLSARAGLKMVIAKNARELLEQWDALEDPARPDLMLQEYIPGGEDAQWMWNGYFDQESRCLFGVTGRKLRQTPPYTGMTSLGVCLPNAEVEELTLRLARAIGYRGILDIGFRFDARDGLYKVLDVNPRLGATFRLFVGEDGMDVARALYLDFTGQEVPRSRASAGRKWMVEDLDLASSIRYWRDGRLGAVGWLRSLGGIDERAWFARDDLRPFGMMCGRVGRAAARKLRPRPTVERAQVARHFSRSADYWRRVYREPHLDAVMYRARQAATLRWIDALPLGPRARVLDVGCGAGLTSVELARRGFCVHALDAVPEMLALAERAMKETGVPPFAISLGDVQELSFADGELDLVVALGLLPWLGSARRGLSEMARVLRPGGYLIATADNAAPLAVLLDPRRAVRRLIPIGAAQPTRRHLPSEIDRLLDDVGLTKLDCAAIGFGPFSLLGRKLFSEAGDLRVQERLQRFARAPVLRAAGHHYAVLAQRPVLPARSR